MVTLFLDYSGVLKGITYVLNEITHIADLLGDVDYISNYTKRF